MFSPNGTLPTQWTPTGSETSFTLSPILTPLAPHQGDLVIVEGLLQEGGGGDGHQNGIGGMLTGSPLNPGPFAGVGAPPAGWATGPSIDQRIVQALAAPTPFQSLELGVQVGAADNWGRMIYQAAQPAAPPHRRSGRRSTPPCSRTCTPIPSRSLTSARGTSRSSTRSGASTRASAASSAAPTSSVSTPT